MTTTDSAVRPPRFIEELSIAGYGCISQATFPLSPLHAFVGPNDSGKSTLLRAVRTLLVAGASSQGEGMRLLGGRDLHWPAESDARIALRLGGHSTTYEVARRDQAIVERLARSEAMLERKIHRNDLPSILRALGSHSIVQIRVGSLVTTEESALGRQELPQGSVSILDPKVHARIFANGTVGRLETLDLEAHELADWVEEPVFLRFDPEALRSSSALIPRDAPIRFQDERGTGLPGVLEAIRDKDEASWAALRDRFLRVFPLVQKLHLPSVSETQKGVEIELQDGKRVGAELWGEGMLCFLAFLAAAYSGSASVLLIEHPENGLHPSRIGDVMRVLRELSAHRQILVATHSPFVLNELQGNEVTVVVRDGEHGTRGTLLQNTSGYEKRSKVYSSGELWASYANGLDEAPLLQGTPKP